MKPKWYSRLSTVILILAAYVLSYWLVKYDREEDYILSAKGKVLERRMSIVLPSAGYYGYAPLWYIETLYTGKIISCVYYRWEPIEFHLRQNEKGEWERVDPRKKGQTNADRQGR